jgi:hypothetical protein
VAEERGKRTQVAPGSPGEQVSSGAGEHEADTRAPLGVAASAA